MCPFDSNGVFSLTPGYLAVTGETIQPTQHNPPLEDIAAQGLSAVLVRDGRAPMIGNLNMGAFKIANLLAGTSSTDAVNKSQLDLKVDTTGGTLIRPSGEFLRGTLSGLTLSNNAVDATNDIDIAVGSAASDGATPVLMTLGSALTKRLDAAWAVGTGNGGLDTGSIANTTYHVWLIQRSDTGVVDALFSTSASSPTMPTNYDRKRRIGSIIRNGGAILAFTQTGDTFLLTVPRQDYNTVNPGTSGIGVPLTVPPSIFCNAIFSARLQASTSNTSILITSALQTDTAPGVFTFRTIAGSASVQGGMISDLPIPGSSLIRFRLDSSDATTTVTFTTYGWKDTRGRT